MTFSLLGRCARTGRLGAAVTTSDIAVGARVPFAAAGVGAVLTQHRTDPRLGPRGLALLASGCDAQATVDALAASTEHRAWRQVAVLDATGRTAAFSGARHQPVFGEAHGPGCVAIGNVLADAGVPAAMVAAFAAADGALPVRLLAALEAGDAAGGETHPLRSAALLVVDVAPFPLVDLRVDDDAVPLAALRRLWEAYAPWTDDFVARALDPDHATGSPG